LETSNGPAGTVFTRGTVEADGFAIRYLEAGQGDPLILLPGGDGVQHSYAQDALARDRRLIQFAFPGYGDVPNDRTRSAREMAETIAAAIAALDISTYALHGTSLGSRVALWLAVLHPDRVTRLVMESPAAFRGQRPNPMELSETQVAAALNKHPERVTWKKRIQPNGHVAELFSRLFGPSFDDELAARAAKLETPVLVLFGIDDGLASYEEGRAYKRIIPNCALAIFHDTAHDIQGDQPQAHAQLVGDFLDRGIDFVSDNGDIRVDP
jgi:pimeloyl-ACP methyl ester carboxylesterase